MDILVNIFLGFVLGIITTIVTIVEWGRSIKRKEGNK